MMLSLFNVKLGEELDKISLNLEPLILGIVFIWNRLRNATYSRKRVSIGSIFKFNETLLKLGKLRSPKIIIRRSDGIKFNFCES